MSQTTSIQLTVSKQTFKIPEFDYFVLHSVIFESLSLAICTKTATLCSKKRGKKKKKERKTKNDLIDKNLMGDYFWKKTC